MRLSAPWPLIVALLLAACGGGQAPAEAVTAEPVAEPAPPPPPPPEPEHVYYQVFWEDLHVMTVYATPGPLRSEEPDSPREVFSGRSTFMSVISHYFEREPEMARLIADAEDLEGFLRILRDNGYEVEELEMAEGY